MNFPRKFAALRPGLTLADRNQGDALVIFIARNTLSARVERADAIDQENVTMMAMLQRNLSCPATIRTLFKRVCIGAPIIEVADYRNMFGPGRKKHEVCGPEIVFCRVAIRATEIIGTNVKHSTTYRFCLVTIPPLPPRTYTVRGSEIKKQIQCRGASAWREKNEDSGKILRSGTVKREVGEFKSSWLAKHHLR